MEAQVGKFTLCGDGLCVGYDSADAISKLYKDKGTYPFKNGTIYRGRHYSRDWEPRRIRATPLLLAGAFAAD